MTYAESSNRFGNGIGHIDFQYIAPLEVAILGLSVHTTLGYDVKDISESHFLSRSHGSLPKSLYTRDG